MNTARRPDPTSVQSTQRARGRGFRRFSRNELHGTRSATMRSSGDTSTSPPITSGARALPPARRRNRRKAERAQWNADQIADAEPDDLCDFHLLPGVTQLPGALRSVPVRRGRDVGGVDRTDRGPADDIEVEVRRQLRDHVLEEVREDAHLVGAACAAAREHETDAAALTSSDPSARDGIRLSRRRRRARAQATSRSPSSRLAR